MMEPLTDEETRVLALRHEHRHTWRDKSQWYWLLGLLEEFLELVFCMLGLHEGPIERELRQISSICMNWLEMISGEETA